jgi:CheY-like chemotaxis protein
MPKMDGLELARRIRQNVKQLQGTLMMLTSLDDQNYISQVRAEGVATILRKPITQSHSTGCNRFVARTGHSVEIANNGVEALLMLQDTTFDLILMDVQMPELGGFETTALKPWQE